MSERKMTGPSTAPAAGSSSSDLLAFLTSECTCQKSDPHRWDKPRQLSSVIAAILKLLDDPSTPSRTAAMAFLEDVLEGTSIEVFDSLGYFDVTFDAVFRMILFQEEELLNCAYPCLLTILRKRSESGRDVSEAKYGQLAQADQLLLQSLKHITLFSDGRMRACVVENTVQVIRCLGFRSAKFLPRMLAISDVLISSQAAAQQLLALLLLSETADVCWPVLLNHQEKIILQLMKVILHSTESDVEMKGKVKRIFAVLRRLDDAAVKAFVEACLNHHSFGDDFSRRMRDVIGENLLGHC